jgi:hypothetical protein
MLKSCIICRAEASPDLQLRYCAVCQSALYCSKACQRKDWKKQHKEICKRLNVGHGGTQLRIDLHTKKSIHLRESFEELDQIITKHGDVKQFFKLFQESTFEGSRAAALEMRTIAKRQEKHNREFLLFLSLNHLILSDGMRLEWPSSPLLVLLEFVDPNVLSEDEGHPSQEVENRVTPLQYLCDVLDPFDYSTHGFQLILAKQLIEHGANVNAVSIPRGKTALHYACAAVNVTNLNFAELLLKEGADPNIQDYSGKTPLICTIAYAPGAAKFLLKWPTTDVNIIDRSGPSFLTSVRSTIKDLSSLIARPDNADQIGLQFLLQQWRGIENMVVERGS